MSNTQEPFGYFKAEPFGWTDCAETDEGAQPMWDNNAMCAIEKQRDELFAKLDKMEGRATLAEAQRDDALTAKAQYQTLLADMTERCHDAEKQRFELQAKVDGLTVELADSRANDIAAMRWLADCRFAVGDDGKRMLPEFVDYLKEIVKQRDELLSLVKKIKEWDISDFALAIPVGLREEMQRLICEAKGGA